MRGPEGGIPCSCCGQPEVKGYGRTLFGQGLQICDRCYLKQASYGCRHFNRSS